MEALVTSHARMRMQQRGIRPAMLQALLHFGRVRPVGGGRGIVFFDKRSRARLERAGAAAATEAGRKVRSYAIVGSDGTVVTVGHRTRRIGRNG